MKTYLHKEEKDLEKYNELFKIWKDVEAPTGFFEGHNGWEHISVKSEEKKNAKRHHKKQKRSCNWKTRWW